MLSIYYKSILGYTRQSQNNIPIANIQNLCIDYKVIEN